MSIKKNILITKVALLPLMLTACVSSTPNSSTHSTTLSTTLLNNNPAETEKLKATLNNKAVETEQKLCFNTASVIDCPSSGEFSGQDAQYTGNSQNYTSPGDGTVIDNVTGLMWTKSPDTNSDGKISKSDKLSSSDALTYCENLTYAGYNDWQLPNIKQGYSLINFQGTDPNPQLKDISELTPFVDTSAFDFAYGNPKDRERVIDSQYASTSHYINDEGVQMLFGVNLADGRIKGYDENFFGRDKTYFVQCVRGNTDYGTPEYVDNGNKTITDKQSGLMWAKDDSGAAFSKGIDYKNDYDWKKSNNSDTSPLKENAQKNGAMDWLEALAYVKQMNQQHYLGYNDWRLPSVKELQTITDFSHSPVKSGKPAIDPIFNMTTITNENGDKDWAFYWSSTTHQSYSADNPTGKFASYVAFGRSMGYSKEYGKWVDVHGAGSQRSDPKVWDGNNYSGGKGPQSDAVRIYNYVRLVRDAGK